MAFDKEISALTAYCEASSASSYERDCVVHSMMNRLLDGRFGKTMSEVCLSRMQYSEWNADPINNQNLRRGARCPNSDPVMQDCLLIYDRVVNRETDPTGCATHYHDKSISPPYWTKGATLTLTTDKFFFYKDVR